MSIVTNSNIKCTIALAALQNVIDPEIGLNVLDLGLIYRVDFDEEKKEIHLVMTLTTHFCPMGESIMNKATSSVQQAFPDYSVQTELVFEPQWNYEMISEEGKMFLKN